MSERNIEQQCAVLDLVVAELRGGDRRNDQADIVEGVVRALRGGSTAPVQAPPRGPIVIDGPLYLNEPLPKDRNG